MCFHLSVRRKWLVRSSVIFPVVLEAKLFQFYSTFRPRISTLCLPIQCSLLWLRGQGEPPACSRDMDLESGPHQCQGTHLSFDKAPFSSVPGQARRICALGQPHAIPICPSQAPLEPVGRWGQCYQVPPGDLSSKIVFLITLSLGLLTGRGVV